MIAHVLATQIVTPIFVWSVSGCEQALALLLDPAQSGVTGGAHSPCYRLRVSLSYTHRNKTKRHICFRINPVYLLLEFKVSKTFLQLQSKVIFYCYLNTEVIRCWGAVVCNFISSVLLTL